MSLVFWAATNTQAQSVSAAQKKPGSVFIYPDWPEFALTVDGSEVRWSATDYWQHTVASGTLPVSGTTATLTFNPGALGYFAVHLVAVKGGALSPEVIVTTAVLPPPGTPPSPPTSPFGLATHFAQGWDTGLLDLMAKAGITRLRDENYWDQIEQTTRGNYVFPGRFISFMATAQAKGIEPLMALTFGNNLYDSGYSPYTDDGRGGYANYASKVVDQYGSQIKEVEIWNEYNGSFASGPAANTRPASYTAMLQKAYEKLRVTHPNVRIGGGAAVLVPLPWFESLFQQGALNYLDALVIHPYRGVPEGVETELAALKSLTRSYNNGVEKPIWVTECGIDSPDSGKQSMSRYLVRLFTLMRSEGVERMSWYFLKDEDPFVSGLLYSDASSFGKNAPSTGFPAFATINRVLGGATITRRETTDQRTRAYLFAKNGGQLRVAWSTLGATTLIAQTSGPLTVTDIMGNSRTVQPANGTISLPVGEDPIYIEGDIISLREIGRDVLVADGAAGYSETTQGSGPGTWQYGYEASYGANPTFQFLTVTPSSYGNRWEGGYPYASLRIDNGHPSYAYGPNGTGPFQAPTIRRWISNVAGPISIFGYSRRSSGGGDGTGIAVRVDGTVIYTRLIAPTKDDVVNFSLRAQVAVGSTVDFMINPGPGTDISYDAIDYSLEISEPFASNDPAGATNADPDGDGLNNSLEAAFGSDPRVNDGAAFAPQTGVFTDTDQQRYLSLDFRSLKATAGRAYQVQVSDDLQTWLPGTGTTTTLQDFGNGTLLREYRDSQPLSAKSRRYLRLHIGP